MKRSFAVWRVALSAVLISGLMACGAIPLMVGVDPVSLNLGALVPTGAQVIYQASASAVLRQNTPISINSVTVTGNASGTNVVSSLKAFIYGRTTDPASDPNCSASGLYYICSASSQVKLSGEIGLSAGGAAQAFTFGGGAGGNILRDGINQNKLWFGLEVTQGASAGMTLRLADMVARVTLF